MHKTGNVLAVVFILFTFLCKPAQAVFIHDEPYYDAQFTSITNPLACIQTVINDNDVDIIFISSCPEEIPVFTDGRHVATLVSNDMLAGQSAYYKDLSETKGVHYASVWNEPVARITCELSVPDGPSPVCNSAEIASLPEGTIIKSWRIVLTSSQGNSIYVGDSVRAKTSMEKNLEFRERFRTIILVVLTLPFIGLVLLGYRKFVLKKKHSLSSMVMLLLALVLFYIIYSAIEFLV